MRVAAALVLVLGSAAGAGAQRSDTLAHRDSIYAPGDVDQRARVDPATAAVPEYPAELRDAGVSGALLAEFVVDTLGAAEMDTFRTDTAANPLFVEAVRAAVGASRYLPAMRQGRPVRQLVQQPFMFRRDTTSSAEAIRVDQLPELLPDSPVATYPPALRAVGVEAIVATRFVVDTAGRVDESTFRFTEVRVFRRVDLGVVPQSEGEQRIAFEDAVRAVIPTLRFTPAMLEGKPVRQLVRMPFTLAFAMD